MLKRIIPLLIAIVMGFALGLVVANPTGKTPAARKAGTSEKKPATITTPNSIQPQLQPLMDNIYDGLQKEDYTLYSKDFLPEIKQMTPEASFKEIIAQGKVAFGKMEKPVFLGSYKKGDNVISVWKSETAKANMDALYTLTVMKINDNWKVVNFYIQ